MFGARYYGSSLGRFMTPDWAAKPTSVPYANFGNPQSLNLYSYVQNNPTTTGDPDGHVGPETIVEDLIEDYALAHPEAVDAALAGVERASTAVGTTALGTGLRIGVGALGFYVAEMINPHTTVGGDKPQTQQESEQKQEPEPQVFD